MAETSHARSRRASLFGLALQIVGTFGLLALAAFTGSHSTVSLAWLLAGGIPIWFVALLVFRQHELAALEAMDLEELRRERRTAAGSEALFGEEGGGPGFLVARARLEWMQRWLVPLFGLLSAVYLIAAGVYRWLLLRDVAAEERWTDLHNAQVGLILSVILFLFLFFYARYAAGLGRVPQWQLLRGCGSYTQGSAIATLAVAIGLAIFLYQRSAWFEHGVAFVLPVVMVLLGIETVLNFILDIYRPRAPGVEPRACFDSRLLGLVSEPGGIAKSLADAINYQFGFQVSQTWFYQLLQKWALILLLVGALSVWLLTTIVVVQPYEHSIVERLGRQLNAEDPYDPGLYFKWPAPFSRARKYNTDQLYEFVIGYKVGEEPQHEEGAQGKPEVELWTDREHDGHEHFDFVIATPPEDESARPGRAAATQPAAQGAGERAPVNLVRMNIRVQYRILPDELDEFTRRAVDPHAIIRRISWREVLRFAASSYLDELMGAWRDKIGPELQKRIAARVRELGLGVEIVYVGVLQVHPERTVAKTYRELINAQQQKIAEIRKARVEETKTLAKVAGDRSEADELVYALGEAARYEKARSDALQALEDANVTPGPEVREAFDDLAPLFRQVVETEWALARASLRLNMLEDEFELGLGKSLRQIEQARERVAEAQRLADAARQALSDGLAPLRAELAERHPADIVESLVQHARARLAAGFWNAQVEQHLLRLEGDAAVALAEAQARRWEREMKTAGEVARLLRERTAYRAAPQIYRVRSYLDVLVDGLARARKYFLAFEPHGRTVHIRLEAQEQARPELGALPEGGQQ